MLDFFLGTVEENAKRELANYDPRTGTRKKDPGDRFGDWITGRGAAIDKAVKAKYVDKLDTLYGSNVRRIKSELANDLTPEQIQRLNLTENTNAKKLAALTNDLQIDLARRNNLIETANLAGYGAEAAGLKTNEISGMLREKQEAKEAAERTRVQTEVERREGRVDKKYNLERLDQNQLLMLQQQNLMADREDRRLDRQMENRLNERRLDMQEARDFRKDRQMAIMQIVKGLQGMGNAFSF